MSVRSALIAFLIVFATSASAAASELHVDGLAPEALATLESELAPVLTESKREGVVNVTIDETTGKARVRFAPTEGPVLEREVLVERDHAARVRTLRWLLTNMLRDEASELLDLLAPRHATAALPPPPPTPPPPATDEPAPGRAPTSIAVVVPPPPPPAAPKAPAPPSECDRIGSFPFAFGLAGPVRLPLGLKRAGLGFDLAYGDFGALRGVSFGMFTRLRCDVEGAVFASAGVYVGRDLHGAAFSSGFNAVERDGEGLLAAAGANVVGGEFRGVALASGANVVAGRGSGFFAATGANVIAGAGSGFFATAGANVIAGDVDGVEAGIVNVAARDVRGAQIGILNIGGKVHGSQLGILNVAADADAAVGIFSVSWTKRVRPYVWTGTVKPLQAGLIFEGKRVFSALNVSRLVESAVAQELVFGVELGLHVTQSYDSGFVWDFVLGVDSGVTKAGKSLFDAGRFGTRVGYRFAERLAPFLYGGAALLGNPNGDPLVLRPDFGVGMLL